MSFIARKISRSKWPNYEIDEYGKFPADPITNCLRTSKNTLSFWEIPSPEDIDKVVFAMASVFERPDTIDIVLLKKDEVKEHGFKIKETEGYTNIEELKNTHRDLVELDYSQLGKLSKLIHNQVKAGEVKRITVSKLKKKIIQAIDKGLFSKNVLTDHMREKLDLL